MRKLIILLSIATIFSCSNNKLEKGTANYELAVKLAEKLPAFDPEENMVIATTSEFDVSVADVITRIRTRFGGQSEKLPEQPVAELKKVLTEFADLCALSELMIIESDKAGIVVSQSEIDSLFEKQATQFGGREKFIEFAEKNGVSEESIKNDIKLSVMHKRFIELKKNEAQNISPEEIDAMLAGDKLASVRHILLSTQQKSEEEKKEIYKTAEELLARAKSGEDFAELAKKYTNDPGSKSNGGLYEDFPKGQMVKPFDEASFSIPIGEISDIVETQYGLHIIKVIDRKKEDRSREEIEKELKATKSKTIVNEIFENLKKQYDFELVEIS